jgi:hypothetical protein
VTLPNKRPLYLPTNREASHLIAFLLGGWVFLGVRELLSHMPHRPSEAQRWAATTKDIDLQIVTSHPSLSANANEPNGSGVTATWIADALAHMRKRGAV